MSMRLIKYKNKVKLLFSNNAKVKSSTRYYLLEEKTINRLSGKPNPTLNLTLCLFYYAISAGTITNFVTYTGDNIFRITTLLSSCAIFFVLGTQEFLKYRKGRAIIALKKKIKEKSQVDIL